MANKGNKGSIKYKIAGKISNIDVAHKTVIVEAQYGGKFFSIGGHISPHTVLKKGNQLGKLEDFIVGDHVVMKCQISNKGDIIQAIEVI
ncbi:MAG: hypothetical protein SWO11_05980 [Thermodesulfobacteriota bacterium]|nr:hypothetical protein [Thermodesulfobacteriota bacterium]